MGDVRAGKALVVRGAGRQRPYLRTKNVFDGRIDLSDVLQMPMTDIEFERYRLRHGDVLLNEGQSLDLVGRCAMYRDEHPEPCAVQNQLVRFRTREGVSGSFAAHLFRHCQRIGVFAKIALQTTSVAHLGVSRFAKLLLAWPPELAEQEAIAEALSDADALIESLEQLLAKKRRIKQGAMQELLTGKKRLPGFSGEWKVKQLGDVLRFQVGFPFSSVYFNETGQGIRLVKNRDLKSDDQVFFYSGQFAQEYLVRDGDLLVGMDGDFLSCRWNKGPALLNQRVGKIVARSDLDPVFAYYYLLGSLKDIENATSATTVKHLSHGDIEGIEKTLPTLPEQSAIATILSDLDEEIAALEARLAKASQIKQGMMQELVTGRIRLV